MQSMRRGLRPLAGLLLAFLGLWLVAASAQAQTSPLDTGNDPLALLQGLSPSEQQSILGRISGAGTLGQGTTELNNYPGATGQLGQASQQQLQMLQQEMEIRQKRLGEEQQSLISVLKGGDWLIIEIGLHLAPRQESQSTLALQQANSAQAQGVTLSPDALKALQSLQGSSGNSAAALSQASAAVTPSTEPNSADTQRVAALMDVIRSRNPYQLSPDGELTLPGFAPIPLLGLSEGQATLRLSVVPAFQGLQVRLTLLPLEKTGVLALKPFGYDLFAQYPTSFSPITDVPVPSNYIVGPGDALDVLLYGNQNHSYEMVVGHDGRINFPSLGPIAVGGHLFSAVQAEIKSRIAHEMMGVQVSVSMEQARSIQVFVMGEAFEPGSYTISGLGTMTSALYAAGGILQTGSLRKVELKRNGVLIRTIDLYDLLIHGSTADDAKLLQGDVVFVPPVSSTVAVDGEVKRPAIYEIRNEMTPAQIVALAGGLTPDADLSKATLTRIEANGEHVVLPLALTSAAGGAEGLHNGDLIHIPLLRPTLDSAVILQGHLYTAGPFAYRPGLRLTDVIHSVDDLEPNADLHYVLVRRELPPDRHIEALSADLAAALAAPESKANITLMPRDQVTVFDLSSSRDRIIQPIIDELRTESTEQQPEQVVTVDGKVNVPGQYPLEQGMKVADLIRSGGGLADAAYSGKAELTRYVVVSGGTRRTEISDIDLAGALSGNPADDVKLEPYDVLSVKQVSQWTDQETVDLRGQVRFPGIYTIKPGETLKSVIGRAGGLTQYAFPEGAAFTRVELQQREQQQMDDLAGRMKIELGVLALRAVATTQGANVSAPTNALLVGHSLLQEFESEKAVGRLVINLPEIMREPDDSRYDVLLRNGDQLIVPKFEQEVTVIGEVQDPTSHLFNPDLSRDDYIRLSGGFTAQADEKRVYVVRADGSVIANVGSRWFNGSSNLEIKPGDTVVVPVNATQMLPLPFWQAVTGIMYNVAIAAAAVHAL
ncbi:MAG TPA: SLBB domain-containing protein [Steroidobacteraceae bacterium]|jgi:protein involved in polysaccharide export with SLBB domain